MEIETLGILEVRDGKDLAGHGIHSHGPCARLFLIIVWIMPPLLQDIPWEVSHVEKNTTKISCHIVPPPGGAVTTHLQSAVEPIQKPCGSPRVYSDPRRTGRVHVSTATLHPSLPVPVSAAPLASPQLRLPQEHPLKGASHQPAKLQWRDKTALCLSIAPSLVIAFPPTHPGVAFKPTERPFQDWREMGNVAMATT